jgi:hypothetical protein
MSEANKTQIGGDHYKIGGEEHWDRVWRLYGRGYFVGCITKYVERYPYKAGLEDLKKARHFLDKLIELEQGTIPPGTHYREQPWPLPKD